MKTIKIRLLDENKREIASAEVPLKFFKLSVDGDNFTIKLKKNEVIAFDNVIPYDGCRGAIATYFEVCNNIRRLDVERRVSNRDKVCLNELYITVV